MDPRRRGEKGGTLGNSINHMIRYIMCKYEYVTTNPTVMFNYNTPIKTMEEKNKRTWISFASLQRAECESKELGTMGEKGLVALLRLLASSLFSKDRQKGLFQPPWQPGRLVVGGVYVNAQMFM